ncbi:glycoside hydrolase [Geomonas sp. RF6]|uniref:amylo-alpha-1,6-glucosidase n=1 Tax=Geomonas sp. RF6 TaxID=2897342 RepID=UPI001E2CAD3C|nr:glycoside hydrolase 100 family protein [Geomonas sp. RF6]UFS72121.1 glycoside hydrolase [Geomonas sp. RF6]
MGSQECISVVNPVLMGGVVRSEVVESCYEKSVELLRQNSTPDGVLASSRSSRALGRHYASIFGRDASICAIGMAVSGDGELADAARDGLLALGRHQAPNGQIPKYVKPEIGEVDFWYAGCIDATLWWLIAISLLDRFHPDGRLAIELAPRITLALRWLQCQEHQVWYLLQQNEASDWADIMPRSGFVLYTNALWYWTKRLYDLPGTRDTREWGNLLFWPFGNVVPGQRRARLLMHYIRNKSRPTPFYLSFVNFSQWGDEVDIFGNLLAHLTGLADPSAACRTVRAIVSMQASLPYPIRVVGEPISRQSPMWRRYMQRHCQNLPWQYHNGGIWPFVGGFWVMLLGRMGMEKEARLELEKLALANRVNDWEFNEWFHGESGEPMGMPGQSWNAALFIMAYHALLHKVRYFL